MYICVHICLCYAHADGVKLKRLSKLLLEQRSGCPTGFDAAPTTYIALGTVP